MGYRFKLKPWMYETPWRKYRENFTLLCTGDGFFNLTTKQNQTWNLSKWTGSAWQRRDCGGDLCSWARQCQSRSWQSHRTHEVRLQLWSKTIWFLRWAFLQRRHTDMAVTYMKGFSTLVVCKEIPIKPSGSWVRWSRLGSVRSRSASFI